MSSRRPSSPFFEARRVTAPAHNGPRYTGLQRVRGCLLETLVKARRVINNQINEKYFLARRTRSYVPRMFLSPSSSSLSPAHTLSARSGLHLILARIRARSPSEEILSPGVTRPFATARERYWNISSARRRGACYYRGEHLPRRDQCLPTRLPYNEDMKNVGRVSAELPRAGDAAGEVLITPRLLASAPR